MNVFVFVFILIFLFPLKSVGTLSKSDRKDKKVKSEKSLIDNISTKKYLGNNFTNYINILEENKSFSIAKSIVRNFQENAVLGYVTPWNGHGYDIAKVFHAKFTLISPVWLQLIPKDVNGNVSVGGLHDIDSQWLLALQQMNKKIKIVPRVIFEKWSFQTLKYLFNSKEAVNKVCSSLIKLAKENRFNGYVIEIWSLLGGQMRKEATKFLITVGKYLAKNNLDMILVIPPPIYSGGRKGFFTRDDFENLVNYVAHFSLMTYDYSSHERPGPNSPLHWLIQCINELSPESTSTYRRKILLGINFYGYDFSNLVSKPIIGHEFLNLLNKYKPEINFSDDDGEHFFNYRSENIEHQVFYPTRYSIQLRLKLAEQLGTGIAIWEIGQGLDFFYDLL